MQGLLWGMHQILNAILTSLYTWHIWHDGSENPPMAGVIKFSVDAFLIFCCLLKDCFEHQIFFAGTMYICVISKRIYVTLHLDSQINATKIGNYHKMSVNHMKLNLCQCLFEIYILNMSLQIIIYITIRYLWTTVKYTLYQLYRF